jgi:hypothetical protein
MSSALQFLSGMAVGAGLTYLLDPDMGRRRRALLRDKGVRALNQFDEFSRATPRDVTHRAQGLAAEARALLSSKEAPDDVLTERVRAHLGRVVSHPSAVEVTAHDGTVTLSGPILQEERDRLLAAVRSVRGVKDVVDRLETHAQPGDHPALQGGRRRPGPRPDFLQNNWRPTTRLLACAAGGLLTAYGLTRSAPTACVLGTVGLGLVARGLTNTGPRRLLHSLAQRSKPAARRGRTPPAQGAARQASVQAVIGAFI